MNDNDRKAAGEAFERWFEEKGPIPSPSRTNIWSRQAWLAACEWMSSQQSQGWISVDDRLPAESGEYLAFVTFDTTEYGEERFVRMLDFSVIVNAWGAASEGYRTVRDFYGLVTHWMALPAPPTTDKPEQIKITKVKEVFPLANFYSNGSIHSGTSGEFFRWDFGAERATIDGDFTADELEAIALWMRFALRMTNKNVGEMR